MNIFHSIASEQLHRYISDTHGGKSSVAFGLPFSARACVLARMERFILWVVPDFVTAERAAEALSVFTAKPVATVSQREEVLLFKRVLSGESVYRETASLWQIAEGKVGSAVVTVDALIKLFPQKQELLNATIRLRLGDDYDLSTLSKALVRAGYRRENNVQAKGQFALRGDILDVFPVQEELPFRAEFFGDTLESLKQFAPETQKSGERLSEAVVVPATDIFVAEEELPQIEKTMRNQLASLNVAPTAKAKLSIALEDLLTRLKDGSREHSLSAVLPYLSSTATLCDYLPENAVVAFDEPKRILDTCRLLYDEHDARFNQLFLAGEVLKGQHAQLQPRDAVFAPFQAFCNTSFSMITSQTTVLPPQAVYSLKASPAPRYNASFIELAEDLKNWRHTGYRVVLCAGSQDSAAMIGGELSRNGVFHAKQCESALHEGEELAILPVFLTNGFVLHEQRLAVIGTTDMLRTRKKKVVGRRRADVFITPEVGDYVVHEVHGVGICRGIARLQLPHEKEYLSIEYAKGDMLYLPCDQLDSLAKYAGAEKAPKLNRIGGKDFSKLKERVKKALREMAIDLQALYAARRSAVGFAFPPDDELMAEFEARFPYQETVDQLSAIAEIKSDMQSAHVMDRLLCGDVGFGKTEVALRAAFKAVEAGKQVAILSPTTILSEQHFHLCKERFDEFGVRVASLNRFSSPKEQKKTLQLLQEGRVDIVSGTHRLLGKDVQFSDLGLLIVDEEQRFGVEDKEKIKLLKKNVDVLTMTATPIPRTLHMGLTGIRDISVIETPPSSRLPVQTFVMEYSETLLRDAIVRELGRGGQAFVLYNRVESIDAFSASVMRIVPEAKIVVAHGQMKEDALERAVMCFYSGECNVLVSTTIIENGIDIPNANTLFVVDSDRLGLSQLHQLRGRVGRSNRLAHVYFTYAEGKILSENAYKRLNSIVEFSEFGSGFKLAMRDLEIRGAGNVLGREQHGHMERVGYDMYVKLLKESVAEVRGEELAVRAKVQTDIDIDAYLPDDYVVEEAERIRLYRRIASLADRTEADEILADLRDVYGNVPPCVHNLIKISLARVYAAELRAETVTVKAQGAFIRFEDNGILKNQALVERVSRFADRCAFSFADKPMLVFQSRSIGTQKAFEGIFAFLEG